jgi:hypothetical protein
VSSIYVHGVPIVKEYFGVDVGYRGSFGRAGFALKIEELTRKLKKESL